MATTNSDPPGRWWGDQLERGGFGISKQQEYFWESGVWRCPSTHWPYNETAQHTPFYAYNAFGALRVCNRTNALGLFGQTVTGTEGTTTEIVGVPESEVVAPSDMMAIGDNMTPSWLFFMRHVADAGWKAKWQSEISSRHQGRVNVLFCDGHIENPKLAFVFQDTNDVALIRWNRDHKPHLEPWPYGALGPPPDEP